MGPRASKESSRQAKAFIVPDGKSCIYVYRLKRTLMGIAVLINVTLDNNIRGVLGAGDFLTRTVEPGTHKIYCDFGAGACLPANTSFLAEPNSKYFIQVDWGFDTWNRNKITQVFLSLIHI